MAVGLEIWTPFLTHLIICEKRFSLQRPSKNKEENKNEHLTRPEVHNNTERQ